MKIFNPFQNELENLTTADLATLREVSEGWYVEYKSELPKPVNIAKAVSAFANTHGGWLIIGVKESSKTDATAGDFCGIEAEAVDGALSCIRQSISSHVTPIPEFNVRVVFGESGSVLDEGRAIICVKVEEGPSPPYMHSKGVIYRRVGDSSEARSQIDRHELDNLYAKREKSEQRYDKWFDNRNAAEAFGDDIAYIRLLFDTNRHRRRNEKNDFSAPEMKELLSPEVGAGSIPIQSVYTTGLGWVGRQTATANTIDSPAFTWIIRGGWREIWWPLVVYQPDDVTGVSNMLPTGPAADRFIEELHRHKLKKIRVVDLSNILRAMTVIAQTNLRLDEAMGLDDKLHVRLELGNVRGCIPFFGSEAILEGHKRSGLPLQLVSNAHVPSLRGSGGLISAVIESDETHSREITDALHIFSLVAISFGYNLYDDANGSVDVLAARIRELLGTDPSTQNPDAYV